MSLREVRRKDKTECVLIVGVVAAAFVVFIGIMVYEARDLKPYLERACKSLPVDERVALKCPV